MKLVVFPLVYKHKPKLFVVLLVTSTHSSIYSSHVTITSSLTHIPANRRHGQMHPNCARQRTFDIEIIIALRPLPIFLRLHRPTTPAERSPRPFKIVHDITSGEHRFMCHAHTCCSNGWWSHEYGVVRAIFCHRRDGPSETLVHFHSLQHHLQTVLFLPTPRIYFSPMRPLS